MKVLEIAKEQEETLNTIYDAALKSGGMQLHPIVKLVLDSVRPQECSADSYIEITPEMDRHLHAICDAALKAAGMQVHRSVQKLIDSIVERVEEVV